MNYVDFQNHTSWVNSEITIRLMYDDILEIIGRDMFSENPRYKELWFLYDTPFKRGREWLSKAFDTIEYHDMKFDSNTSILDKLIAAKKQMKKDREIGLKLW